MFQATPPAVTSEGPLVIDWYTTHACLADHLIAEKSCRLTNARYSVDVDLTPLSNGKVISSSLCHLLTGVTGSFQGQMLRFDSFSLVCVVEILS